MWTLEKDYLRNSRRSVGFAGSTHPTEFVHGQAGLVRAA